jgi:glycyl-tRNA synthetase beta chain
MPELLFELGCEEIPAEDLEVLPSEFKKKAEEAFRQNRLVWSDIETHATPRRIVLHAILEAMQTDLREEKMGPPLKAALDAQGSPTNAGLGFARNAGIPFQRLKTVTTPKGEYLCAEITVKGRRTEQVLKEVLPSLISQLPFRKYMKWDASGFLFGRPIRNVLLLFDGKVIRLNIAGTRSSGHTFGHRFLGPKKRIPVKSYEDYLQRLAESGVVLCLRHRMEKIARELQDHAVAAGGIRKEDPELLQTMANEVEYPEVLTGRFSPDFLSLPQEILMNAMRKHQKYFCALDPNSRLLPVFFTVLNTHARKPDLIRSGHERVLDARLRDAEFFWREDLKISLAARRPMLSRLTYQEKLGNYQDKIRRMAEIASRMLSQLKRTDLQEKTQTLVENSKVDLLTHMVGEFPELQGIMGGLYAKQEGYPEEHWQALYDQYLPVTVDDPTPRSLPGAILSLTDRIETLCSGFVLNKVPTGSRDPYALRRTATGAVRIVLEHQLDLNFELLFDYALSLYSIPTKSGKPEMVQGLLELIEARFRFLMEQKGLPYDILNSVLTLKNETLLNAYGKTNALWAKRDSEDLKKLARGFRRINNIISDQPAYTFQEEALIEDGETRLHRAFSDLEFRVQQFIQEKEFLEALEIMVTLGPEIDNFFDEVLVMTDDPNLRQNRIALLQRISKLYRQIADFSALQIEL